MKPFHLSKHFHDYNKLIIISYLDMDKQYITTTSNLPVKRKIILQVLTSWNYFSVPCVHPQENAQSQIC